MLTSMIERFFLFLSLPTVRKELKVFRISAFFLLLTAIIPAAPASAQFLGQMAPASCLAKGGATIGGYVVAGENATAIVGSMRYGLTPDMEGRARLGFIDPDNSDINLIMGADLKYKMWGYQETSYKFDFALGGLFEFSKFNDGNKLSLGGSTIASAPFAFENNMAIEPFTSLQLRVQRTAVDEHYIGNQKHGGSESDLKLSAHIGTVFKVSKLTDFTMELQIDEEISFKVGLDIVQL